MRSTALAFLLPLAPLFAFAFACSTTASDAPSPLDAGAVPPAADGGSSEAATADPACETEGAAIAAAVQAQRAKQNVQHAVVAVETPRCKARVFRADDPASQDTVTDESLWRIGSVTKTFVSAAVLNLAAAQQLGLDDTLEKYLPTFPNAAGISLRQLLNHTSGVFNYTDAKEFSDALAADPKKKLAPAELLAFATSHPVQFEPGKGWEYSNTNYVILGLVLEKVGGGSLGKVVRELAIGKAGLTHTFLDGEEPVTGTFTPGYTNNKDVTKLYDPSVAWAAGAVVSTPSDLLAWVHALYGTDLVLSAASKKELFTFVLSDGYGLGVSEIPAASTLGNGRGVGHGGSIFGFQTQAYWFEETKLGLVSIVSDSAGDPNGFSLVALQALRAK